jgi:hypothetical protein
MELYGLSNETNDALQRLLRSSEPTTVGQGAGSGGSRQVVHVRVTAGDTDGFYPCVPTQYNSLTNLWEEYTASVCFAPNDETLTAQRYLAIRYGLRPSDGKAVYVVVSASSSGSSPDCTALGYLDPEADSLTLTITSGVGSCAEEDTTQTVLMLPEGGVWVGQTLVTTPDTPIRTTDCAACPSPKGMPVVWDFTFPSDGGCSSYTGNWTITYTSSCTWTGTNGTDTFTLVLASGTFTLTVDTSSLAYSGSLVNCTKSNTLTKTNSGTCTTPPTTITITPHPSPVRSWTAKYIPANCTTPYPQCQLVKTGGSGSATIVCLTWMGCGSNGNQFIGGGPVLCGGDSGGACNSGSITANITCGTGNLTQTWSCPCKVFPKALCLTLIPTLDYEQQISLPIAYFSESSTTVTYRGDAFWCNNYDHFQVVFTCSNDGDGYFISYTVGAAGFPADYPPDWSFSSAGCLTAGICSGLLNTCDPFYAEGLDDLGFKYHSIIVPLSEGLCGITGTETNNCCQTCINGSVATMVFTSSCSFFGVPSDTGTYTGSVCASCGVGGSGCVLISGTGGGYLTVSSFNLGCADGVWTAVYVVGGVPSSFDFSSAVCTVTELTLTATGLRDQCGTNTVTCTVTIPCVDNGGG